MLKYLELKKLNSFSNISIDFTSNITVFMGLESKTELLYILYEICTAAYNNFQNILKINNIDYKYIKHLLQNISQSNNTDSLIFNFGKNNDITAVFTNNNNIFKKPCFIPSNDNLNFIQHNNENVNCYDFIFFDKPDNNLQDLEYKQMIQYFYNTSKKSQIFLTADTYEFPVELERLQTQEYYTKFKEVNATNDIIYVHDVTPSLLKK